MSGTPRLDFVDLIEPMVEANKATPVRALDWLINDLRARSGQPDSSGDQPQSRQIIRTGQDTTEFRGASGRLRRFAVARNEDFRR